MFKLPANPLYLDLPMADARCGEAAPPAPPDKGWLDPRAAEEQLKLVLESLEQHPAKTPPYEAFLSIIRHISKPCSSLLDIGCGVGGYMSLLARYYPNVTYRGCDVSPEMIRLARETFGQDDLIRESHFFVRDAMGVRKGADVILASSLIEVLPNWRDVLRHLFSLDFHYLILGRVRIWSSMERETRERTYETIYGTESFEVVHNWPELADLIWEAGGHNAHTEVYQIDAESQLVSLLCTKREDLDVNELATLLAR